MSATTPEPPVADVPAGPGAATPPAGASVFTPVAASPAAAGDSHFRRLPAPPGVAHLQLCRPERLNAMDPGFFPALRDAVLALADDGATRALVISSTGRHFSAGMSLDVFGGDALALDASTPRARLAFQTALRRLMRCLDVLGEVPFPVIAAVQGGCIGGALDLAAACDIRLAAADAFFTVQEIHIGMAADLGVLQRLPRLVPPGVAREMAFTGERLPAARALAVGLVNAVHADAPALHAAALAMAASIAAKSPLAVAGSKLALNHAVDHPLADSLQQMTLLQSAIFDTEEMTRAIDGWKTKQAAVFEALAVVPRE